MADKLQSAKCYLCLTLCVQSLLTQVAKECMRGFCRLIKKGGEVRQTLASCWQGIEKTNPLVRSTGQVPPEAWGLFLGPRLLMRWQAVNQI